MPPKMTSKMSSKMMPKTVPEMSSKMSSKIDVSKLQCSQSTNGCMKLSKSAHNSSASIIFVLEVDQSRGDDSF